MIELWAQMDGQGPRLVGWWMGREEADEQAAAASLANARLQAIRFGMAVRYWLKWQ